MDEQEAQELNRFADGLIRAGWVDDCGHVRAPRKRRRKTWLERLAEELDRD